MGVTDSATIASNPTFSSQKLVISRRWLQPSGTAWRTEYTSMPSARKPNAPRNEAWEWATVRKVPCSK